MISLFPQFFYTTPLLEFLNNAHSFLYTGPCGVCHKMITGSRTLKIYESLRYHNKCFKCAACGECTSVERGERRGEVCHL